MDKIFILLSGLVSLYFILHACFVYYKIYVQKKVDLSKYEKVVKVVGPLLLILAILNYYQGYKAQEDEELYDQILYEVQSEYEDQNYDYGSGEYNY